jgi:hypothetical protein
MLWTMEQGGRTTFTPDDSKIAVKCLFVANLKYNLLNSREIVKLFHHLDASEAGFDRWWTLDAFDGYDAAIADIANALRATRAAAELSEVKCPVLQSLIGSAESAT